MQSEIKWSGVPHKVKYFQNNSTSQRSYSLIQLQKLQTCNYSHMFHLLMNNTSQLFVVIFDIVEHLKGKLAPVITSILGAMNKCSFAFFLN